MGNNFRVKLVEDAVKETLDKVAAGVPIQKTLYGIPNPAVNEQPDTNTGPADQPAPNPPMAPVVPGGTFGNLTPRKPMDGVNVTDHKPKQDKRFRQFLQSLEATLGEKNYRAMLVAIAEFNSTIENATNQSQHHQALSRLAGQLKKIMTSDYDIVKVLKMSGAVAKQTEITNWGTQSQEPVPEELGDAMLGMVRRALRQNNLNFSASPETNPEVFENLLKQPKTELHKKVD